VGDVLTHVLGQFKEKVWGVIREAINLGIAGLASATLWLGMGLNELGEGMWRGL